MERILIIKLGAIGDVVHSLPVLGTLRAHFPEAHLSWAVEDTAAPVIQDNPDLDELILLERKKLYGIEGLRYFKSWLSQIRKRSFDVVLDLHNLFKTGIIAFASHAPVRIGFRKLREGNFIFMNRRMRPDFKYQHAVEKYLCLLGSLGIQEADWKYRFPLAWGTHDEQVIQNYWEQKGLGEGKPVVAINPGAQWKSKRWMPDRYGDVADQLVKTCSARIIILWGPGERFLAEKIAHRMTESALIVPELNLKQLMALIRRCRFLMSGDSGPVHLAAALKVPTVVLFGPSDPKRNGPYGEGHVMVQSRVPSARHWQIKERGDRWMKGITVEQVLTASLKHLAESGDFIKGGEGLR